jgi:hypothetical protein
MYVFRECLFEKSGVEPVMLPEFGEIALRMLDHRLSDEFISQC